MWHLAESENPLSPSCSAQYDQNWTSGKNLTNTVLPSFQLDQQREPEVIVHTGVVLLHTEQSNANVLRHYLSAKHKQQAVGHYK